MDCQDYITESVERKKGQHLQREERGAIQHLKNAGYTNRAIARAIGCSPTTVGNELKRGTPSQKSSKGRKPGYSARRGEAAYKANRKRSRKPYRMQIANTEKSNKNCKGESIMKIAVTYENGQIFQHFGHTEHFKLYEAVDGKITHAEVVDTNGSGHGALAGFLMQNGVDTLICGGIGGGAQAALAEAGIKLYGGVSGDADAAVSALLNGNLGYNPNVHCDHHDHEHGEEGHTCGNHGCGKHSCH